MQNWEYKKLGDVCDVIAGQSPEGKYYNQEGRGTPFYQGKKDFGDKYLEEPTTWTTVETKIAIENDILMSVRAPVGDINICNSRVCIGRGLAAIRASKNIDEDYLFYFLLSEKPNITGKEGAVFASINRSDIANLDILVPPLEEQKRIVKILDEKFAMLETVKANAKANLQNAKDLLFAELTKTFEQDSWKTMSLQDVCTRKITDGTHQTPKYCTKEEGGYPFISSKDVTKEFIDWSNIKYIVPELHEELYKRIAPQKDDILLAKNGTTGVAAIVEDDKVFDIYVTLAVLRPNKNIINPRYLLAIVNSPLCKEQFNAHLKGSGVPNLHLEEIQKVLIPIPPLDEQKIVVKNIEELKIKVRSLEEIYTKQLANCDELKQAFLAKAFNGEL